MSLEGLQGFSRHVMLALSVVIVWQLLFCPRFVKFPLGVFLLLLIVRYHFSLLPYKDVLLAPSSQILMGLNINPSEGSEGLMTLNRDVFEDAAGALKRCTAS